MSRFCKLSCLVCCILCPGVGICDTARSAKYSMEYAVVAHGGKPAAGTKCSIVGIIKPSGAGEARIISSKYGIEPVTGSAPAETASVRCWQAY